MPRCEASGGAGDVLAVIQKPPLPRCTHSSVPLMYVFSPFTIQSFPSFFAVVLKAATSEPPPASVVPMPMNA